MAGCSPICPLNARDAVKKARKRVSKGFLKLACALLITGAAIGCSSITEQDVFDLPCGPGRLVLHETFVAGFSIDKVILELCYRTDQSVRVVCALRPNSILYRDPAPDEHYQHFRGGVPSDPWPIFVDPKRFTPAEYGQICQTLANNLDAIDAAVSRRGKPTKRFYDNRKPRISSIRYLDCNDLRKLYGAPDKRFKIEVNPNGQVCLLAEGMQSHMSAANIGYVVGNGSKVVLDPNPGAATFGTDRIVTNLHAFVQQCVDVNGRSLRDDFIVEVPANAEAYRLEGLAWMARRDSRR